ASTADRTTARRVTVKRFWGASAARRPGAGRRSKRPKRLTGCPDLAERKHAKPSQALPDHPREPPRLIRVERDRVWRVPHRREGGAGLPRAERRAGRFPAGGRDSRSGGGPVRKPLAVRPG